jgi:hypothetical protein
VSTILGVSDAALEGTGAFNGFVDVDSLMHVDPHLLTVSSAPELRDARRTFDAYFRDVAKLLAASKREDDYFWSAARDRLTFKEIPQTALGHSKDDTGGSGIGPVLAGHLTRLAKAIIDAGINNPDIFDLLGLFQDNVGPDRISDMTVRVVLPHLLSFAQRVAGDLNIKTASMRHLDGIYQVPANPRTTKPIVLIPRDVLRPIPIAFSWSDIDYVAAHNRELRQRVNRQIGATWKHATSPRTGKEKLREVALRYPALVRDIVRQYREKPAAAYDFDRDPDAVLLWHSVTRDLAHQEPLDERVAGPLDPAALRRVVGKMVDKFKTLVETNRLSRLLYKDDGSRRPEKIAQLAFYGLAEAYCEVNNFDVSPEADAGAGPVDFKISSGYDYRGDGRSEAQLGYRPRPRLRESAAGVRRGRERVSQLRQHLLFEELATPLE